MRGLAFLVLACSVLACGGGKDDLTPYVKKLIELDHYVKTLQQYKVYLTTEGMTNKANDTEQIIVGLIDELEAYPEINNKHVRALHNKLKRTLKGSLRKMVEPDFPTFVPNAQRVIDLVEERMEITYAQLDKLWKQAEMTEPFPLSLDTGKDE
jgi:Na+/phosphate symporter